MKNIQRTSCVLVALALGATGLQAGHEPGHPSANDSLFSGNSFRDDAAFSQIKAEHGDKQVKASKLIGKDVKNDQDEKLGSIKDLIVDVQAGSVPYAIVSVGGTAGIGAKRIAVPVSSLQCAGDGDLRLSATKAELESASTSPQGNWAAASTSAWARDVDGYYGEPLNSRSMDRFEREPMNSSSYREDRERVRMPQREPQKAAERTMNSLSTQGGAISYDRTLDNSSDQALERRINDSLERDGLLATAQNVDIDVNNGEVTLRGSVPTDAQKQEIESEVRAMSGVHTIHNHLDVTK